MDHNASGEVCDVAAASRLVEKSGGVMLIESQPGQGTTVNMWLPLDDSASTLLGRLSCRWRVAGALVLLLLDSEPINLILSDLSMGWLDGIALLRHATLRRSKMPAIVLTGFTTNAAEIAVGGAVIGMLSLLHKPVTEQELA